MLAKYGHHLDFTHFHQPFWGRKWQPTPVFLPGESHGQRSLAGYSPWGRKESDMTERLSHTQNSFNLEVSLQIICWEGFLGSSVVTNLSANAGDSGSVSGSARSLGGWMATQSNTLAWEIPWTEEPGGLQSTGSQQSQTWLRDKTTTIICQEW